MRAGALRELLLATMPSAVCRHASAMRGQLDAHGERIERAREVREPDAQHVAVLDLGDRAPHGFGIVAIDRARAAPRGPRATCATVRVGGVWPSSTSRSISSGVSTSVRARYALAPKIEPSRRAIAGCSSSSGQIDHASPRRAIEIAERAQRLIRIGGRRDLASSCAPTPRARSVAAGDERRAGAAARARELGAAPR